MGQRQYFRDLTPGEIQWIKVSSAQVSVDGIRLARTSYLYYRPDGTSGFDEFSPKQRATIFAVLDSPNVRQITSQYDRLLQGGNPTDADYRNANFAILGLRDQIPFDSLPLPRAEPNNNLNLEDEIVQQRIADVITKIKFNAGTPEVDPGNLTEADRAIVIDPNSPNTLVPTRLTAAEARAAGIEGYELIDLVATTVKPLVIPSAETVAATERTANYTRVLTRQDAAVNAAADIIALNTSERDGGLRIVKVTDDNKTITATDQFGTQHVVNRDEFNQTKTAFLLIAEEEENQLQYFKSWAEERGVSQQEIQAVFAVNTTGPDGIAKLAANKDYQDNLTAYKELNNGKLPFATPATDAQLTYYATDPGRYGLSIAADNARRSPVGGVAADKLESTGGTDTETALLATENARLKIAADNNDALKRDAIVNGAPPVANPSLVAQSAVAAVDTTNSDYVWGGNVDLNGPENNKLTKQITDAFSASTVNETIAVQNNPLDQYESYTYGIALHVLTKGEYDNLGQNSKQWRPQHTLIASAGRWQESDGTGGNADYMKRQPGWEDNFYFDNLKMTQLQSPSSTGRSTNTIEIEFTIVEPYGLTLLDRLIRTANLLKEDSYMHLCYMLQIDFFDSQKGLLIELRKYLPITLNGMNIKVSGKGTQYICAAYPFHYKALMQTISTTPLDVDVVSDTLRSFFADDNIKDTAAGGAGAEEAIARETERINAQLKADAFKAGQPIAQQQYTRQVAFNGSASLDKNYQIHSYPALYNGWWKKMKDLNAIDPNIEPQNIKVRFADEIIKGEKLTKPIDAVAAQGPMAKVGAKQGLAVAEKTKYNGFGFKAGTGIIEVINTAMMASDYVRNQVRLAGQEESQAGNLIGTVNWWKILPQVKLNGFDNTLNRWSYSVIYFVVPYKVWNTKHPNLPKSSPRRTNCVKQYNYLYTGDNRSVIDFQVEFDMLYFTTVAGFKQINIANANRPEPGKEQDGKDSNNRGKDSNTITPVVHNLVPQDASNGNNLTQDAKAIALGTIQDSIYSGVNGEMLTVNMKIIGDPTLIKQDDLFINIGEYYDPNARSNTSDGLKLQSSHHASGADPALSNNSIVTDAGEVLAWVQILMPPDIDEHTGGLRLGAGASSVNSFTGVYKIMEVQNEFSQGKFIQTLVLIRYQQQDADEAYRKSLEEERQRIKNNDAGVTPGNLARSSDSADDAVGPDTNNESRQVATNSTPARAEESILTQTASTVGAPSGQLNLLDTGNYPESVIEKTDLA